MSMIAVDTLKFAKRLKQAGMPDDQAEALAEAQAALIEELAQSTLATRGDLTDCRDELQDAIAATQSELHFVRSDLKEDIASLRGELQSEVASLRGELSREMASVIKWNVATMIAMTAIILAALRLS